MNLKIVLNCLYAFTFTSVISIVTLPITNPTKNSNNIRTLDEIRDKVFRKKTNVHC